MTPIYELLTTKNEYIVQSALNRQDAIKRWTAQTGRQSYEIVRTRLVELHRTKTNDEKSPE